MVRNLLITLKGDVFLVGFSEKRNKLNRILTPIFLGFISVHLSTSFQLNVVFFLVCLNILLKIHSLLETISVHSVTVGIKFAAHFDWIYSFMIIFYLYFSLSFAWRFYNFVVSSFAQHANSLNPNEIAADLVEITWALEPLNCFPLNFPPSNCSINAYES